MYVCTYIPSHIRAERRRRCTHTHGSACKNSKMSAQPRRKAGTSNAISLTNLDLALVLGTHPPHSAEPDNMSLQTAPSRCYLTRTSALPLTPLGSELCDESLRRYRLKCRDPGGPNPGLRQPLDSSVSTCVREFFFPGFVAASAQIQVAKAIGRERLAGL